MNISKLGNYTNLCTGHQNSRRYDGLLVDAVKQFQRMYGLEPDGIIGNATLKWLNTSPTDRAGLLAINIQRLRIIPNESGSGMLVNISVYTLHFYSIIN